MDFGDCGVRFDCGFNDLCDLNDSVIWGRFCSDVNNSYDFNDSRIDLCGDFGKFCDL